MNAPDVLLDNLRLIPGMESGSKRLVILMSQLGDFDSLEADLSLLGEVLESRFGLEDQLISGLHRSHSNQVSG